MISIARKRNPAADLPQEPRRQGWVRHVNTKKLYISGIVLSLVVGMIALLAAYFAGTAPRLPHSIVTLEALGPAPDMWAPLAQRPVSHAADAIAPEQKLALLPRSPDPAEAPPIDLSDLPPPANSSP
jgi:hypothetical protein